MTTKRIRCRKCRTMIEHYDSNLFWEFRICNKCNHELSGVLRETVNAFIGVDQYNLGIDDPQTLSLLEEKE